MDLTEKRPGGVDGWSTDAGHRGNAEVRELLGRLFTGPPPAGEAPEETYTRRTLSAAHMLSAHFGMDDLVWNHISARRAPGAGAFLITPGGRLFDEVSPACLVDGSAAENVTGDIIHGAIYAARPDVGAIVHTHTTAITAVGAVPGGLRFLSQDAARYFERTATHAYDGVSTGEQEQDERAALGAAMSAECAPGAGPPTALLMQNHGAVTVGRTVEEAWVRMYYLDVVCRLQLAVAAAAGVRAGVGVAGVGTAGGVEIAPAVLRYAREQFDRDFPDGRAEWPALLRRLVLLRELGVPVARQLR
eukprot:g3538.t1